MIVFVEAAFFKEEHQVIFNHFQPFSA